VAVVTGATRGIGRSIAETFADEGAHVAICARNAEQVTETVAMLEAKGVKAWGQALDIADSAALKAFVEGAAAALGGIDVLVSNASALVQGAQDANWQAMLNIDVLGAVRCFDAAKPFLLAAAAKTGDAAFIITSSVSAAEATSPSAYGAMKAAQIHYAKGLGPRERSGKAALQRRVPWHGVLRGRRLGQCKDQHARFLRPNDQAQPNRPDGHPGRDCRSDGVLGESALGLHHRHQHAGGWRDLPAREFLGIQVAAACSGARD
jgi:hypothetical protein